MTKLYKIGFWVLLSLLITATNFWRAFTNSYENEYTNIIKQYNKKVSSLMASNIINNRKIDILFGTNIITENKEKILNGISLVILLSEFRCSKCQEKELKRINSLKNETDMKNFNIIGITTKDKIGRTIRHRKIVQIDFPIYWVDDTVFYNKLAFDSEFPQILYIVDGIVLSAFKPIPKDDEFSEKYYKRLLSVINKK